LRSNYGGGVNKHTQFPTPPKGESELQRDYGGGVNKHTRR